MVFKLNVCLHAHLLLCASVVNDHIGNGLDVVCVQRRQAPSQVCLAAVCCVEAVQVLRGDRTLRKQNGKGGCGADVMGAARARTPLCRRGHANAAPMQDAGFSPPIQHRPHTVPAACSPAQQWSDMAAAATHSSRRIPPAPAHAWPTGSASPAACGCPAACGFPS